jgi:hypothetical protein
MRTIMRQQRTKIGTGLLLLFAGLAAFTGAQQRPVKCPSEDVKPTAPGYRIGLAAHSKKNGCELYLYISVDPSHFVREDMLALAERLNQDFCYEKQLTAILLDDYYAARHPLRNTKAYWDAERGTYYFDRKTGRQFIKFSTSRDKRKDEVEIDLNFKAK